MRLPLPTVSSRCFHYDPETKTFSAEASELPNVNFLSPIYDDACDAGFAMVSERTGMVATFCLSHADADVEGAVRAWRFEPVGPFGGVLFGLRYVKLVIFND